MPPLEDRERKILYTALLSADTPADSLGALVGEQGYQIRRSLTALQRKGVATPYTLINQFLLGSLKVGVYFSFRAETVDQIGEAIEKLVAHENVVSVVELFGPYQYFMSVNVKSIPAFEEFMACLCDDIPFFNIDETISLRTSLSLFKRKYLNPQQIDQSHLSYSLTEDKAELDGVSIQVLNAIIQNGGLPNVPKISSSAGISQSHIHNKIKELKERGVIVGYSYNIDSYKLGYYPYDLLIKTSTRLPSFKKEFFNFCSSHLFIVGLTECIGYWQYEIRIEAESPSQATAISQEITSRFSQFINKTDIISVCKEIKYMRTPAIKNDAQNFAPPNRKAQA